MSRLDRLSTRSHPEVSTVAVLHHSRKHIPSRAPMVNPYDKFTQPEFDAWIGDMTGSLRRALGFEQEDPLLLENIHVNGAVKGGFPEYPQLDLSDQDEAPDDSFAQIKTRRDKGKARDPREGPGLGKDRTRPIEVVSSDEEEEDEVKDLAFRLRDNDLDVDDQNEDAESDYLWERSSPSNHIFSSPPTRIGPPLRSRQESEVESNAESDDEDNGEYEYDDEDFVNQANHTSEVISITSDEDESGDEGDENDREFDDHNRPGPSSSRYARGESYEEDKVPGAGDKIDEIQPPDDISFPPRSPHRNLELNDPWAPPRKEFYSGGELRLPPGAQIHPDRLGPLDEGVEAIEGDEELTPDEVDRYNETSSNLPSASEFYQAYYSEGNATMPWDQHFDPRFFARAEDVDSGINFSLSPRVLTPNQSELRTHLDETGDAVASGFTPSVFPLRRNEPIPQDAEIIALDDSDEEDSLEVIPPLETLLEMIAEHATRHPEEPEVWEESQTNYSASFGENINSVGEDEVLSIQTAHTEDIEHESRLQPFEVVEPEAADSNLTQESLAMAAGLGPDPPEVNELELEEQDNDDVEIIEPGVMLLNALPLDARPKSMTVDELAPHYYEDFDDIYGTPVPEILPPDPSEGLYEDFGFSTDNKTSQDIEVEGLQVSSLSPCPAGSAGMGVNDNAEVSSIGGQSPLLENNGDIVPESTSKEESSLEASRNTATNVGVQNAATLNGLRKAVSALSSPKLEDPLLQTPEFASQTLHVLLSPSRSSVPGQPKIPMPVMADANVPDPTESPTRLQEHPILSIPGTPDITVTPMLTPQTVEEPVPAYPSFPLAKLLHSLNPNADGLFTPADFSTSTTPAEDGSVAILPSEWHETDVMSSETAVSVDLQAHAEFTDKPATPSPKEGVSEILTEADIISSRRKSVLMADPYPYCLSTPIVSISDDASSDENDDNSVCSHSTPEKENEKVEVQFAFPLAADIEPHINSQPETMELEVISPLTEFELRARTTSTQNPLGDTTIEELGISPTMEMLQYPFEPTMELEDLPAILADASVEGSQEQFTAATRLPLEAGVDADLQARENPEGNPETPFEKTETDTTIPEDSHLAQTYVEVKQDDIPQVTEAIKPESRSSKRKRATSPDPDGSDDSAVKSRGKLRARSRGKQRGEEAETDILEQPEHDTIYVRPRPYLKRPAGDSAQHQTSVDAGVSHLTDTKGSQPPHPQFHPPTLFHAHGRTKRQKTHIQPIASVKQPRDYQGQPPQPTTRHTPVLEKPPLQSGPSRDPSPVSEPSTAGSIAAEVALPSANPSQLSSTAIVTPVPTVDLPQDDVTTFPQPSSIAADKDSQPIQSTPTTTAEHLPAPLQSSPARFLQASGSTSSIRSTRSQCKYHKITLPIGENGRRVCFLVPGCSLANQELMKEEDIEDHGEATYEDGLRMIQNIDHLDFDSYLIGTLRQLVGLDIIREGEVFYLPQPGDDLPIKHWPRKSKSDRTTTAKGSDYASFAGSSGYSYSGSAHSPSTRPPHSNADSVFTSLSGNATADDDQSPLKKWKAPWKGKTKDNEHDEELQDEESQKTRRKSTKRGVKRTRTFDDGATGNDGTRKSKRLRQHLTDSSLYQTQQHD